MIGASTDPPVLMASVGADDPVFTVSLRCWTRHFNHFLGGRS